MGTCARCCATSIRRYRRVFDKEPAVHTGRAYHVPALHGETQQLHEQYYGSPIAPGEKEVSAAVKVSTAAHATSSATAQPSSAWSLPSWNLVCYYGPRWM